MERVTYDELAAFLLDCVLQRYKEERANHTLKWSGKVRAKINNSDGKPQRSMLKGKR